MERIVKITENHVEVQTVYYDQPINGDEVITERQVYGQIKIDCEMADAIADYDYWDTISQEEIDRKKAEIQIKLDELQLIQRAMNS